MKKWILLGVLLGALPIASRTEIVAAPQKMKALKWPTFRQVAAKKASPEVKAIQYLLRSRGFYNAPVDGVFGAQTTKSVRAFQHANGLKSDGIVAAQTFPKLIKTIKRGDRGDAVRAMQTLLRSMPGDEEHGMSFSDQEIDGVFGFNTEMAVRNFQSFNGLKSNGIIGRQSWHSLFGGTT